MNQSEVIQNTNEQNMKDRSVFIIGLLAVFLTLTTFKEPLSQIIVPLGSRIYSLWNLTVYLISTLMISVYLTALSYIRFNFQKYQEKPVVKWTFRVIIFLSDFFYSVALLFPLLAIITSIIQASPLGVLVRHPVFVFGIMNALLVLAGIAFGLLNAFVLNKKKIIKKEI